ncbi:unnamed protein product, partial [Effrenium voratum]
AAEQSRLGPTAGGRDCEWQSCAQGCLRHLADQAAPCRGGGTDTCNGYSILQSPRLFECRVLG